MPKATLPWGALHYEDSGSGPALLLVSGLNGLAAPWQSVVPVLARHFRVITHDHRGLGASDRWTGPYSVDQIAADVIGLMDHLGIERADIVGHSLGGATAQALAADYPNRVGKLVIYASWAGPDPYFTRVMTMRRDMLIQMGVEAFLRTGPIGIYPPRWIREHDADFTAALPGSVAAFPGTDIMLARMDCCLAHDRRACLATIRAPTLVIGLDDDMSTPADCSREIAAAIPGAALRLLPYGGHNAHVTVPATLTAALFEHLAPPHGETST